MEGILFEFIEFWLVVASIVVGVLGTVFGVIFITYQASKTEYKMRYGRKIEEFEKEFGIILAEQKLNEKIEKVLTYKEDINSEIMKAVRRGKIDEKEKNIIKKKLEIMNYIINKEEVTEIEIKTVREQAELLKNELIGGDYYSKTEDQINEHIMKKIVEIENYINEQEIEDAQYKKGDALKIIFSLSEETIERYSNIEQIEKIKKIEEYRNQLKKEYKETKIIEDVHKKITDYANYLMIVIENEKENSDKMKKEEKLKKEKEIAEKIISKIQSVK